MTIPTRQLPKFVTKTLKFPKTTIGPKETIVLTKTVDELSKPIRFILPDKISNKLEVNQIRIGQEEILSSPVSGKLLSEFQNGFALKLDKISAIQANSNIYLTITNKTTRSLVVDAKVMVRCIDLGPAAYGLN